MKASIYALQAAIASHLLPACSHCRRLVCRAELICMPSAAAIEPLKQAGMRCRQHLGDANTQSLPHASKDFTDCCVLRHQGQGSGLTFRSSCRKSSVLLSAVFLGIVSVPAPSIRLKPVLQRAVGFHISF